MIPESHYPDASLLQDLATALVMIAIVRFIVLPAIQFDGKFELVAVEVQNMGRNFWRKDPHPRPLSRRERGNLRACRKITHAH
jgi:hypothetical protein